MIVQNEGDREVLRSVKHYNPDVIISVGYRVKSLRGTQFRRWALKGVIPGWHMNKEHWDSVVIDTDVPEEEVKWQIGKQLRPD